MVHGSYVLSRAVYSRVRHVRCSYFAAARYVCCRWASHSLVGPGAAGTAQGTEAVCPSGVSYLNVTHLRVCGFVLAQLGLVQSCVNTPS